MNIIKTACRMAVESVSELRGCDIEPYVTYFRAVSQDRICVLDVVYTSGSSVVEPRTCRFIYTYGQIEEYDRKKQEEFDEETLPEIPSLKPPSMSSQSTTPAPDLAGALLKSLRESRKRREQ